MSSRSRIPRRWTKAEDAILSSEAESQLSQGSLRDWSRIAAKLPGRTNKDCRKRWTKICTADLKKGAWSPEEDEKLRKAVSDLGQHWTQVAQVVGTRHADQCAKRWNHSLDPKLDHSKWTPELDELLVSAIAAYGRVWKTIGEKNFPSRSATDLKNRYLIVARRQKLQNASLSTQSTPSLSPSNSPSATHKTAKMAHGASPTSTLGMDHSDDEYERIDSRTIGPSNPLIADFSSTEQMWLSSPDTPGSCEFTFTCLPSVDTPSSENSASAGSISFPFPDVGTDEKFNPTVNAFEGSSIMGKLEPYDGWEPPSVCNSHLRPNCLPSSALVKTDDYHTNSTNTAPHSPLLSYSPNLFSYNETVAMPPNADPFSDETDFIFTDHNSLGWQEQHHNEMHVNMHGIESGMDMNFDFLGEEEGENITRMGLEHSTDSGLMEDGSDMKDGRMEIPLNTMILEDVHPDMVRDLMGVLLRSKERVKMRMYSQE